MHMLGIIIMMLSMRPMYWPKVTHTGEKLEKQFIKNSITVTLLFSDWLVLQ